jgi:hypothetical protein
MAKKSLVKTVFLACTCSMLCSCNTAPSVSLDLVTSEMPNILQSESTADQATGAAAVLTTIEATHDVTSETQDNEPEYDFVPVLSEEDIEYMGIPYKDLTADQFIQLWAQCETEDNVQRLYVISYNNCSYTDELTGEPIEPTELETEQLLKEFAIQNLIMELMGRMESRISNVVLIKDEYAPDGYYDSDDSIEHYYRISYTKDWSDLGNSSNSEVICWITLKKISGYWKIGITKASSPPAIFLPES